MERAFKQRVAPGGTITGTGSPFPAAGLTSYTEPEEEPEVVRYIHFQASYRLR